MIGQKLPIELKRVAPLEAFFVGVSVGFVIGASCLTLFPFRLGILR